MMMKQRGQAVLIYMSSSVLIRLTFLLRAMELHAERAFRLLVSALCCIGNCHHLASAGFIPCFRQPKQSGSAVLHSRISYRASDIGCAYINFKRRWTT